MFCFLRRCRFFGVFVYLFAFGWVDQSGGWIIGEVLYVIVERYEGLSFRYAFSSVLDVELRYYGLCFLANIVNKSLLASLQVVVMLFCISFSCWASSSSQRLVVLSGDEGFRRAFDSLYFPIQLGLKFVFCVSELDIVYHVHEVCFESIQIFMSREAFSRFKSVFI